MTEVLVGLLATNQMHTPPLCNCSFSPSPLPHTHRERERRGKRPLKTSGGEERNTDTGKRHGKLGEIGWRDLPKFSRNSESKDHKKPPTAPWQMSPIGRSCGRLLM